MEWEARTAKIPLQSPKVRAERKKEGDSSQPQILLDADSLWPSLGLLSLTSRAQNLPDLPGLCLHHGAAGGRGVGTEGDGRRGQRKRSPNPTGIGCSWAP